MRSVKQIVESTEFKGHTSRTSKVNLEIEESTEIIRLYISRCFGSLFNAYGQAFNRQESRTGALFEKPFRRIEVKKEDYFSALISYIHRNPSKYGIISDFRKYPHSSYQSHLSERNTSLEREEVLGWFGGKEAYIQFHHDQEPFSGSKDILLE